MFCMSCHKEYAEGVRECPNCNQDLIEIPEEGIEVFEAMKPVKVTSVTNSIEANMIMDLLQNNGIPCIKKDNGPGGYMNLYYGFSVYGEDIYVDERDYQKANSIIEELRPDENSEQDILMDDQTDKADELNDIKTLDDIIKTKDDSYDNYPFYRNPRKLVRIYLAFSVIVAILIYLLRGILK